MDARVALFERLQLLHRLVEDADVRGPLGALEVEADRLTPVYRGAATLFGVEIAHRRDVREADRPPIPDADPGLRKVVGVARIAEHADGLFGPGDLGAATGGVEVDLPELRVDLRRGEALRLQLQRIEDDADFAADAAVAVDRGHAGHRQQFLGDGVVDVPAKLFDRHVAGDRRIAGEIVVRRVRAEDLRFQDAFGQVAADLRDLVARVVDRAVDRRADRELDDGGRLTLGDGRGDFVDTLQRPDRRFDAVGDLIFQLRRRRARLADDDDDDREIDVGIVVHVHPHEADDARQRQRDEQDDRRNGVPDRPGGDVAKAHVSSPFPRPASPSGPGRGSRPRPAPRARCRPALR
ncbi:hypothetical protein WR25_03938 [Diploscapter pachys]|uniref:Uncharacterized protein n=1 Tax=Diploscapter pachys TaxID=2018661 RepID=A0A2A2M3E0_9BILA|nr:hypothetical protein WR25_03938 [Diploscapter pachys]